MSKYQQRELPIRSKIEMAKAIGQIIAHLHRGEREAAELLLEDLKARSIFLSEQIQQDVLMFAEQIQFQYDYDPWHKVTQEVERAANKLIEDLGWHLPY